MFSCSLCRAQCQEYCFVSSHCSACEEIRRIISLYDRKDVLQTLRMVYLRDEEDKRKNRTIAKSEEKEKVEKAEKSEPKLLCESKSDSVITRSKSKA